MKTVLSFVFALFLLGPAYALACPGHAHAEGEACPCMQAAEEKPCCAKKAEGEACDCQKGCEACAAAKAEKKDCGCDHAEEA